MLKKANEIANPADLKNCRSLWHFTIAAVDGLTAVDEADTWGNVMLKSKRRKSCGLLWLGAALFLARPAWAQAEGSSAQASNARESRNVEADLKKQIAGAEAEASAKPTDSSVLFNLALLYHQDADYQKSIPLLKRLTALAPDNDDAALLLGLDQFHTHHYAEAKNALKRAVEINSANNEANFYLALSYLALDRKEEADQTFARMASQGSDDLDEVYYLVRGYTQLSSEFVTFFRLPLLWCSEAVVPVAGGAGR